MSSPWLLVLAGGITVGALFGLPGVLLWTAAVAVAAVPGRRSLIALTLAGVIGAATGSARVALDDASPIAPAVLHADTAEVVVRSVPLAGPSGTRAVVRVEQVLTADGTWSDAEGDVLAMFRKEAPDDLAPGDRLRVSWAVSLSTTGDSGWSRFVRSTGAGGSAQVFSARVIARGDNLAAPVARLRDLVTRRVTEAIPGDGGALVAGFVTGDDSGLTFSARYAFERTGMSHITAVSGSNVAVLLTMWYFIVRPGRLRRSIVALAGVTLLVWLYVVLVGMGPGAVRAGLFAAIILPAARLGRRPDPLTALALASAAMLMVQPGFADNVGFWLSLAASAAIVTSIDRRARAGRELVLSGVVALVAAQVATLPIIVVTFGGWSPASIGANLILAPIVSAFFPVAFVVALLVTLAPWLAAPIGWLPGLVSEVILAVVERLAGGAAMLRLGAATSLSIALLAGLSLAILAILSGDMRRWLNRVAWRFPGIERYGAAVVLGAGLGVWLAVVASTMTG